MKKPVIEFVDFTFQYRAQANPTLHGINLTIYEGEKVLIVGPSGSGKSTLAHCVNGLVPFFYQGEIQGSLKIRGKESKDLSIFEISSLVGTVLQDPDSQFLGLTVGEDIAFKLENLAMNQPEMKERVLKAAQIVNIDSHLEASPHELSGGQKQRVTLAGVLVDDVDILLFDEPLASLDPATGKSAIELIDEIHKQNNKTILIIEHRVEDVLHRDVDRIIVVSEGKIVADLRSDEIVSSDILRNCGIREPLYIKALKDAGCTIVPEMLPSHIETIQLESAEAKIKKWFTDTTVMAQEKNEEVVLALENVSFGYDAEREILHDVTFEIHRGEMVSILGTNGAGKSTISKLVCGFYRPTKGRILFDGQDLSGESIQEISQKIGMVLQNPNHMISQHMIYDEVAFGLKVRGIQEEEIKERVYETLKICGLYPFRNWPISALSYGQKKRVTIASILVLQPGVIILDEPTAGQDYKHYTEIMEFLVELNKSGVTIIMITHDMHLMQEYTSRAIVISGGQKIGDDVTVNIITNRDIIQKANLKETSLYQLAEKLKLEDPKAFVRKFIEFERRER